MLKHIQCFISGLVDIVDSNGGHIILLVLLVYMFLNRGAEAYLDLAVGALLMKLKDASSNRNREAKYATPPDPTIKPTETK